MLATRKSILRLCLLASTLLFGAAQLVRPRIDNPPVRADLPAPPAVKQVLRRACYDCHSNETQIPWFDQIAPAYWLVARDVREGRKHLNFSELGKEPAPRQKAALFESVNHVLLGAMPPPAYLAVHRSARVSERELATLKSYLRTLASKPAPSAAPVQAAEPPLTPTAPSAIPPAPNGIEFPRDYASWRPISSTERFDNGSLRAVLGNERAVRAILEADIDPWPDGAALAKVAWLVRAGAEGVIGAGAFHQVEFMFKDGERYAKTAGWGFARWRGADLKPYGRDANFADECVSCHAPLRDDDYVFTTPIQRGPRTSPRLNGVAALAPVGAFAPLESSVLSLSVDPHASTLSVLHGNSAASARTGDAYPPGSVLALVTWKSREDERWFGARVPGQVARVDLLKLESTPAGEPSWSHEIYERGSGASEGAAARLVRAPSESPEARARRDWILSRIPLETPGS
jgi:hypothetical protein